MRRGWTALTLLCFIGGAAVPLDPGKSWIVAFSNATMNHPWRRALRDSMSDAAKKHPEIKLVMADGNGKSAKQIQDVENFIRQKVDLLVISPNESQPLTAPVGKAFDAGIPVILLDRGIDSRKFDYFIGGNNLTIGRTVGEFVAKKFPKKANIVEIQGTPGASATIERHKGFRDVIRKYPGIKILVDQVGDYRRAEATKVMENALLANKQIDVVYCHNDDMALGSLSAIKRAGRKGIVVIGVDGQREAVKAVVDGEMAATVIYPYPGPEAVQYALRIKAGKRGKSQRVELPTPLVTKVNAKKYYNPKGYF